MDRKQHWEQVYTTKSSEQVSWFQVRPIVSLKLIGKTGAAYDDEIIDVGSGASTLVDNLLARGHRRLTVLDISANALSVTKTRLGDDADAVRFVEADVTQWEPDRQYRAWHDRAAFHFLTDPDDRRRYVMTLKKALAPDGQVVLGTFSTDGPKRCSDLDVVQYDEPQLSSILGPDFECAEQITEKHITPWGSDQLFFWARFTRRL